MGRNIDHGHTEGYEMSSTYISWLNMKNLCCNKNNPQYKNYGALGIKPNESWLLFTGFLKDMGKKPKGMKLVRIDTTKGFCKKNCKWGARVSPYRKLGKNKTSKYKFIHKRKEDNRWIAQPSIDGKQKYLGIFSTELEAYLAVLKILNRGSLPTDIR